MENRPEHPLDNPVRASLLGAHARFAERKGRVLRYPADMSPFMAMPSEPDAADWADAAALAGPGGIVFPPAADALSLHAVATNTSAIRLYESVAF